MCCARRLLLPYECHVKGVLMNFPPQLHPKHFQTAKCGKDEGDGPLAVNHRLLPVGLPQVGTIPECERETHGRCQEENVPICTFACERVYTFE